MPSLLKPLAAVARDIFRANSKARASAILVANLEAAERINPCPEFNDFSDNGYGALYGLMGPPCIGDGLWKCCMGHEQELIHWTGAHPFKYLKCIQCDHVLCRWCLTTEVLTPLQRNQALPNTPSTRKSQPIYGQVCPQCGLSHHVRPLKSKRYSRNDRLVSFKSLKCPCGSLSDTSSNSSSDSSWPQFQIGPIDHYRHNPYEAWFILTCQRTENSIRSRRASPERHAQRSSRSASVSVSPPSPVDDRSPSADPRPMTSDSVAAAAAGVVIPGEESPRTAWSLRVHQVDQWQDFVGRRPWDAPMYVVVDGPVP